MKKLLPFLFMCPVMAIALFSCAASPKVIEPPPEGRTPHTAPLPAVLPPAELPPVETIPEGKETAITAPESTIEIPPVATAEIPERKSKPKTPEYIMGKGIILPNDMVAFLLEANPAAEKKFVENLAFTYREEAAVEGVNHDTAFAQMCLETGFLRFGGLVMAEQNNFCGLGATGPGYPGAVFPNPRMGVRAHIQHLKAYATDEPLKQELVDPRFYYVRYGSSPEIRGLAGTWAADLNYAEKIRGILERLYNFVFEK